MSPTPTWLPLSEVTMKDGHCAISQVEAHRALKSHILIPLAISSPDEFVVHNRFSLSSDCDRMHRILLQLGDLLIDQLLALGDFNDSIWSLKCRTRLRDVVHGPYRRRL